MSGTDFFYFFRNEPRNDIKTSKEYIQYSKLLIQLEKTKFRLRYAPYDNEIREQEIVRVLTLDDLGDDLKESYKEELKQIRDNRRDSIKELRSSINQQILNLLENEYLTRFFVVPVKDEQKNIKYIIDENKMLTIMMGLGLIGQGEIDIQKTIDTINVQLKK